MTSEPDAADGTTQAGSRRERSLLVAISVAAGVIAAIGGPSPTGSTGIDVVLVAIIVGAVTWLSSTLPQFDAAVLALVAGIASLSVVGAAVGVAAAGSGFFVRVGSSRRGVVSPVLVGVALAVTSHSRLGMFFGASSLVGLGIAAYVVAAALGSHSRRTRRTLLAVAGAAAVIALVATLSLATFGYLAADDLRSGNDLAENGLEALGDGDVDGARTSFTAAADAFDSADHRIDTPLTYAARFVPGVAQHRRVATELTSQGAASMRFLAAELEHADVDSLSITDGRIDVAAVRELGTSLSAIDQRIGTIRSTIADLDSPWLLPAVRDRVDRLDGKLAAQGVRSSDAVAIATAAPALFGADGRRTYFVGFTTPAEARGSGGLMGNWAVMTIDDGQIAISEFGRSDDLDRTGDTEARRFPTGGSDGFDEWLARYGPFNLSSGPDGTTGAQPWKNMNMSPNMPSTGRAIANLYPQSGGEDIDGVVFLDVETLARFLEFTGPISFSADELPDGESTLTADNAARFLLNGQYDVEKTDRVDALETFSRRVVDELFAGTLPPPTDILDTLGPMVEQQRLTAWMSRPDEQAVMETVGIDGSLPSAAEHDGLAIAFNNAVGNKIDYYLDAAAEYTVTADASTSMVSGQLELTMANGAPTTGQPEYVIGNPIGLPWGTTRILVSVFTKLPVTDARLDGEPIATETGVEQGYVVTSAFVVVPAGQTGTLTVGMSGQMDVTDGYVLSTRTPPTVRDTPLSVDATWTDPGGGSHRTVEDRSRSGVANLSVDASTPA